MRPHPARKGHRTFGLRPLQPLPRPEGGCAHGTHKGSTEPGILDLSGQHMAEPLPRQRRRRRAFRPPPFIPLPGVAGRYLEGLKPHETGLAVLILDDEEGAPIFIEGEGPHRRHGGRTRRTGASQQPARNHSGIETAPSSRETTQNLARVRSTDRARFFFSSVTFLTPKSAFWNPPLLETSIIQESRGVTPKLGRQLLEPKF